jgi:hypothetical protein
MSRMSQALTTLRKLLRFRPVGEPDDLESVAALTPEEFAQPVGGSFGSHRPRW